MAVFEYVASNTRKSEEFVETGTVIGDNEEEARAKLVARQFDKIRLKRVRGFSGIFKKLNADIR